MRKTKEAFEIQLWNGKRRPVKSVLTYGYQTGIPGLAVTMDFVAALDNRKLWSYTHIRSGHSFLIGKFTGFRKAIKFAQEYLAEYDWLQSKTDMAKNSRIRESCGKIRAELRRGHGNK